MSERQMTDGEREEALEAARSFLAVGNPNSRAALVARALLSTSAAVRGMREALETIRSAYEDQNLNHRDFRVLAGTASVDALNGEQNG